MAEDFKNDPQYQQIREDLYKAKKSKWHWLSRNLTGAMGTAGFIFAGLLELGALGVEAGTLGFGTPVAIAMAVAGVALFGYTIHAKHKYFEASKDEAMLQVEATAQRSSHYVTQALAQQQEMGTGSKFQDMVNAQRGGRQSTLVH